MSEGLISPNHEVSFQNSMINPINKKNRVKPKFFKLLGQIMNDHIDVKINFIFKISQFSLI